MPDLPLFQLSLDLTSRVVAGGITVERTPYFSGLPVSLLLAGRAIHPAADPLAAAMEMRSEIARRWARA